MGEHFKKLQCRQKHCKQMGKSPYIDRAREKMFCGSGRDLCGADFISVSKLKSFTHSN
jgi:hypothetical protein